METKLSVNLNKVALIRNARGGNLPDLVQTAIDCQQFGADGITVHPRPDERHVRYDDLKPLREAVTTEFNIEGYPSEKFLDFVCDVKPDQCTLVPDPPGVLTSSEGWDVKTNAELLKRAVDRLKSNGIRVSLFLDPKPEYLEGVVFAGADRIELYTGDYAQTFALGNPGELLEQHKSTAKKAKELGLGVNAGHDFNLNNLGLYKKEVQPLHEVSIGQALVSDALYQGWRNAILLYRRRLT